MCGIGRSVVLAKFAHTPGLKKTLLATGNAILAEATRNDRNWGIGLNLDHPDLASPRKWQGANILGWSLMEARHELGGAPEHAAGQLARHLGAVALPIQADRLQRRVDGGRLVRLTRGA